MTWKLALGTTLACAVILGAASCAEPRSLPPVARPARAAIAPPFSSAIPLGDTRSDAQRRVADFLGRVATVRHLRPRAAVEARELDRPALIASVREHVAREVPLDVIRNQGELLVGLGLVPPDFDYGEGAFRLLETQLAGFYEPHDKKMYLASDLRGQAADATLAHELVHALQDQHYDLGNRLAYHPEANDRASALQALAEGDATSAMMDLLMADTQRHALDVPDDVFAAGVESSMNASSTNEDAPRVLRASLVAPYVDGLLFVHALRRRAPKKGGDEKGGWAEVDRAWRSPPETTEQLLHLDKYDAREPAESVVMPLPPSGNGWTSPYDDVFGEEGLRIAFEEWLPKKAAAIAADGWAGDRVALFRRDAGTRSDATSSDVGGQVSGVELGAAWHIRFDPKGQDADAEARQAFKALTDKALADVLGVAKVATSTTFCADRPSLGPLAVARSGRDLVLAVGPYRRDGKRVAPVAVCTQTVRWAADILSKHKP